MRDIEMFGGFRPAPTGLSYETKLFAVSLVDAEAWGRQLYGEEPHFVVEVRVPQAMFESLYHGTMDSRPAVAVYPEALAEFNAIAEFIQLPTS